jgi:Bacteriophage head to tail connecting protein
VAADLALLHARYQRAHNRMVLVRPRWQELAEFLLPYQSNVTVFGWEARKKTSRLFHSYGVMAADKLARTMHGTITSPAQQWHSLVMRQSALRKIKPIQTWLEEIDQRLYLTRNQSNFSMEIGRLYASVVTMATGALYLEEGEAQRDGQFGGFRYTFLPIGTYAIEQNAAGEIDTLYRDLRMPLRDAIVKFPADDLGPEILRRAQERPDDEIDIVHAIYPRQARDSRRPDHRNMPWASVYFTGGESARTGTTVSVSTTGPKILRESGFPEKPFMVWRWDVSQRETWGTGPGHIAYPDVRSLNRVRELKLESAAIATKPPLIATKGLLLTQVNMSPGAVMLREPGQGEVLQALDTNARFDVAKLTEDDMKAALDQIFYVLELMLPDKGVMTLGEAQIRVEERMRLLGPTMGRAESELLKPMIAREVGLMSRGGAIPPPPPELLEVMDTAEIDIRYEGPLARAQRSAELVAIDRKNAWLTGVREFAPSAADAYDFDEEARVVAEVTGVPAHIVRDPADVARTRQVRAQMQQQREQAQMLMQGAQAAGQAAPMLKALQDGQQQAPQETAA